MASDWRPLTDQEIAAWPMAQMGGALLWIVGLTTALTVYLIVGIAGAASTLAQGGIRAALATSGLASAGQAALYAWLSWVQVLTLLVWSATVFACSVARVRSTAVICVAGAVSLFVMQPPIDVVGYLVTFSQAGAEPPPFYELILPFIPRWLGAATATMGLAGYMLGGVRPNAFFRRRVAVAPS